MSRSLRRLLVVLGGAAALTGLAALPAAAHVTVNSPGATQGGFGVLAFRVPTESDTASTIGVKVQLPAEQPLAFVSVRPTPGWTYTVTRTKLDQPISSHGNEITEYTSVIEWKAAAGGGIKPGEFQEFEVSGGPLPEADAMTFKAIQTYSDGKVVSWIEEPAAGAEEPDFPAPTLRLAAPAATGATGATGAAAAPATPADTASSGSVTGAYVLGGAGLLAGLAALALALGARRRVAPQPPVREPAEPVSSTQS